MARINLLPWRQEERQRKNKEFMVLAGAIAAIAVLVVLLVLMVLNNALSNQQTANEFIENENKRLDAVSAEIADLEQQREQMLSRMKVIQDLQGQRSVPVRVWDDIARAVPPAMYLTAIKREGDVITISGAADNPNVVSQLVRNLDASPWLTNSGVPNIQTNAQAYQSATAIATAAQQDPANANKVDRPIYPEDSYIQFTVTTQVKPEMVTAEEEAATAAALAAAAVQSTQEGSAPAAAPATQQAAPQTAQPVAAPAAQSSEPAPAAPATSPAPQATAPTPATTEAPVGGKQ